MLCKLLWCYFFFAFSTEPTFPSQWLMSPYLLFFCRFSRIRLYNRSSQSSSQTTMQSVRQILTTEGPMAFYKGFSTHFMRIGPHFTLTFVFLGMLKRQLIEGSAPVEASKPSSHILHPKDESTSSSSSSSSSSTSSITTGVIARREEQI